jgi:hypothetical protein
MPSQGLLGDNISYLVPFSFSGGVGKKRVCKEPTDQPIQKRKRKGGAKKIKAVKVELKGGKKKRKKKATTSKTKKPAKKRKTKKTKTTKKTKKTKKSKKK